MEVSYDGTLGAVYVGIVAASCLYGVVSLQLYTYWSRYKDDGIFRRVYILVLWILDTLKLACATATGYDLLITQFSAVGLAFRGTWAGFLVFGLTTVTTFMVQLFFAYRAWYFSKKAGAVWANPTTMRLMAALIVSNFRLININPISVRNGNDCPFMDVLDF
ncbi:unnamed protein product [Rhizoctonia solani]|uniref:Uncharacterized protein n=1 Tax=Rhizoctonia solani TaxID=456999 RepID=A0A8H3GUW4_9AGAM|nr:unnamed protein product [Rhizoctonia solani]